MFQKIIDTHLHVWDFNYATYEWLRGDTSILNRNYFLEEVNEERLEAGVSSVVLVQAANNFEDTNRMLQLASATTWVTGVVGWLPLTDPDATELALDQHYLANKYFKGVRHLIHNETDKDWLVQEPVIRSLRILDKYELPYDVVGVLPAHIRSAIKVAERVPGLKMVFDHLNQPPIKTKQKFGAWGELMKEAAGHQNFFAKISGLGTASGDPEGWTEKDLAAYVEFILLHFGEDRCFCGSDWPVSLLSGSYSKHWKAYINILQSMLSAAAMEKLLHQNATIFYNL